MRSWNIKFDQSIKSFEFVQSLDEPCVYKKSSGNMVVFFVLYVDDILDVARCGSRGDRRRKEGNAGGLRVRGRRGGRRDHPREGWGALAALFREFHRRRRKTLWAIWSDLKKRTPQKYSLILLTIKSL